MELHMRINLNFTKAIMVTEEDASITDLAGKLSQTSMSPLPLRSILTAETYISKYGDWLSVTNSLDVFQLLPARRDRCWDVFKCWNS